MVAQSLTLLSRINLVCLELNVSVEIFQRNVLIEVDIQSSKRSNLNIHRNTVRKYFNGETQQATKIASEVFHIAACKIAAESGTKFPISLKLDSNIFNFAPSTLKCNILLTFL